MVNLEGNTNSNNEGETSYPKIREDFLKLSKTPALIGAFYKRAKRYFRMLPLFLALYGDNKQIGFEDLLKKDQRKIAGYLDESDLPLKAQFLDWYLSGRPLELYNKFAQFKEQRVDDKMTQEEIDFRERIAQNIFPFGYGVESVSLGESLLNPIPRIKEHFKINAKEIPFHKLKLFEKDDRLYSRENIEKLSNNGAKVALKTRVDLFRLYLGLPQFFDTLQISPYKPTKAKSLNATYYCFDQMIIVANIKDLKTKTKEKNYIGSTEISFFDALRGLLTKQKRFPYNYFASQLGKYVVDSGYDEDRKERYVSYYDVWDLDPPILKEMGIDIDQFNFPFEIYGRIYESDFN